MSDVSTNRIIVFRYMPASSSCPVIALIIRHGTVIFMISAVKYLTHSPGSTFSLFAANPIPTYINTTRTLLKITSICIFKVRGRL